MPSNQKRESPSEFPGSPWPRIFVIISCFLLAFLAALFWSVYTRSDSSDPWIGLARRHAADAPGDNALGAMVDAIERVDWRELKKWTPELQAIAVGGWNEENAEMEALIKNHQLVFNDIGRAASMPSCDFPGTSSRGIEMPRPDLERLRALALLAVANGRMLAAHDREEEALQRLIEAAVFGARLTRPYEEATLSAHLAGMAMLELATGGIIDLLRSPGIPDSARDRAVNQLSLINGLYNPIREAFLAEADVYTAEITARGGNAVKLAEGLRYFNAGLNPAEAEELARALKEDARSFPEEQERVWIELSRLLALPIYEQPVIDADWFEEKSSNRLVRMQFTGMSKLTVREGVLLARLRIALVLAALGAEDAVLPAEALADPFSPEPLRITPTLVYSIGPDGEDQFGERRYNPADGVYTEGDIAVSLGAPDL